MSFKPYSAKAKFAYASEHADDLNFDAGELVTVTGEEDDQWLSGAYTAKDGSQRSGIFPRNFVERYEEPPARGTNRVSRIVSV